MYDTSSLAAAIQHLAVLALPFVLAITCHEFAHGYVSWRLGDPTPAAAGRLTLNPLKHLDVMGTLVLVVTQFIGWAKPVPVNFSYYKNYRQGIVLVSLAGPAANFLLMLCFIAFFKFLQFIEPQMLTPQGKYFFIPLVNIARTGISINAILALFNLLPIPPLDGSKALAMALPNHLAMRFLSWEKYGFIVIIVLAATGYLGKILSPLFYILRVYIIQPLLYF